MTDVSERSAAGPMIGGVAIGLVSAVVWSALCLVAVLVGGLTETGDTDDVPAMKGLLVHGGLALLVLPVLVGLVLLVVRWRRPGFGLGTGIGLVTPATCVVLLVAAARTPLG